MGHDLSDTEWRLIKPLLPNKPRGVPRVDDRRVINGILHILRTRATWRELPPRYGPYTTIYNRFVRWSKAGVWLQVVEILAHKSPQRARGLDAALASRLPRSAERRRKAQANADAAAEGENKVRV